MTVNAQVIRKVPRKSDNPDVKIAPILAPFSTGSAVIVASPNEALQDEKS